ncbi:hypothetical protein ACVW1A_007866 [Bradyrhizobium sp. LB1.3]
MADLAVRSDVVGPDQVARIDVGLVDELVDLDCPCGLQRDPLQLFLGDLDELVLLKLVTLNDVLVGHLVAGVGVDLEILDPMTGLPI